MYFLLGVLMATLVALLVLPAVWHRAVRLTTRRVEAAVPVSIFEVQADKDQQRAFFALNQRRLELQLDSLRENLVAQAATIETQRQKIHDLQRTFTDLDTRHALLTATGAERDVLLGEVQDQASDRARRIAALEAEATARGDSLATLATELDDARRQIEIARQAHAGAQTQIGTLESSLTARVGELGGGGMGIVYLAREVCLARRVAINLSPPELAARPALRERFFREARTAARLSPAELATSTLYTSTEPCSMCCGAIFWAGIPRVVYALAETALNEMLPPESIGLVMELPSREVFARGGHPTEVVGPIDVPNAAAVHAGGVSSP